MVILCSREYQSKQVSVQYGLVGVYLSYWSIDRFNHYDWKETGSKFFDVLGTVRAIHFLPILSSSILGLAAIAFCSKALDSIFLLSSDDESVANPYIFRFFQSL